MKEFQVEHVKNLPDAYRKDTSSNNYKILQIEKEAVNDLRTTLREINGILSLDNARGKTLDVYGERVGQARGAASDAQYLLLIKSKIIQNISNGTHNSVINGMSFTLGCDPSDIVIVDGEQPCSAEVLALPLGSIVKAGFSSAQVVALINRLMPSGTILRSFMFDGTFEFCESEADMVYDEEKGFSEAENGSIGGYLGVTDADDSVSDLPI